MIDNIYSNRPVPELPAAHCVWSCLCSLDTYFHQLGGSGRYPGHREADNLVALGLMIELLDLPVDLSGTQPEVGHQLAETLDATNAGTAGSPDRFDDWVPLEQLPPQVLRQVREALVKSRCTPGELKSALADFICSRWTATRQDLSSKAWTDFQAWLLLPYVRRTTRSQAPELESLLEYVAHAGRVCPLPLRWNDLWDLLPEKDADGARARLPLPLILGGWVYSTLRDKRQRLALHIRHAAQHGALAEVDEFLRGLPESEWLHERDAPSGSAH